MVVRWTTLVKKVQGFFDTTEAAKEAKDKAEEDSAEPREEVLG